MTIGAVDRIRITTVVDNYIDNLRQDDAVARRYSAFVAGKMPDLRAEHGLAHLVEVTRGGDRFTMALDFGLTPETLNHNFRELALDPTSIDALGLSHGHRDHWGGLTGFLHAWRRRLRRDLPFYGGVELSGLDEARITRVVDALSQPRPRARGPAALHGDRGDLRRRPADARAVHRQLRGHHVRVRGAQLTLHGGSTMREDWIKFVY